MTLYFIRHGETIWNKEGRFQGNTDIALSEKGIRQARRLQKLLQHTYFDAAYTSPLKRAIVTAQITLGEQKTPLIQDSRLKELDFGEWDGYTHTELSAHYQKAFEAFERYPHIAPIPGEGSMEHCYLRVAAAMEDIRKQYQNIPGNILIVGHSTSLKMGILHLLDLSASFFYMLSLKNGTVTVLSEREGGFTIEYLNACCLPEQTKNL